MYYEHILIIVYYEGKKQKHDMRGSEISNITGIRHIIKIYP